MFDLGLSAVAKRVMTLVFEERMILVSLEGKSRGIKIMSGFNPPIFSCKSKLQSSLEHYNSVKHTCSVASDR